VCEGESVRLKRRNSKGEQYKKDLAEYRLFYRALLQKRPIILKTYVLANLCVKGKGCVSSAAIVKETHRYDKRVKETDRYE